MEERARSRVELRGRVGFGHLGSDPVQTFQENEDVIDRGDFDLEELLELRQVHPEADTEGAHLRRHILDR